MTTRASVSRTAQYVRVPAEWPGWPSPPFFHRWAAELPSIPTTPANLSPQPQSPPRPSSHPARHHGRRPTSRPSGGVGGRSTTAATLNASQRSTNGTMDPRFSTDSAVPATVLYQPPPHRRPQFALSTSTSLPSTRGHHSRAVSRDSAAFGRPNQSTDITSPTTGAAGSIAGSRNDANGIGIAIGSGTGAVSRPVTRTRTKRANTERLVPTLKTSFEARAERLGSPSTPQLGSAGSSSSARGAKFTVGNVSHGRLFLRFVHEGSIGGLVLTVLDRP